MSALNTMIGMVATALVLRVIVLLAKDKMPRTSAWARAVLALLPDVVGCAVLAVIAYKVAAPYIDSSDCVKDGDL